MKKTVLLFFTILFFADFNYAQTIFSNGTGGGSWSNGSTWQGGVVPDASSDVFIAGSDSVFTETEVTCNSLTVLSGGRFATGVDPIIVAGITELEADAYFYNRASTPSLPGSDIFLDPASYVVHSGSGTVGDSTNFEFGNLVIQRDQGVTAAVDLIINGNLIINMSAANQVFRGTRNPTTGSLTHTVYGDVYIYRGTFSCVDVGDISMTGVWDIKGNVYVIDSEAPYLEARIGLFSSASAVGTGIINIGGDLIIDGGRLQGGTSSTPGTGTGIINLNGNLTLTENSGISSTTHAGPFAINFVGDGTQTVTLRCDFSVDYPLSDTIGAGSEVIFDLADSNWNSTASGGNVVVNGSLELMGNSNIDGAGNFILNPGATLKIGAETGIAATDSTTGNIRVTGSRTYSSEANYEYKGTDTQVPGDGLPAAVNGLTVNNSNSLIIFGDYTINNSLNIINGDLDLNGSIVTLGENAVLTETPGNTVIGLSGKLTTTRNIGVPSSLNVGGLGAVLTAGADMGSTTVERFHSSASGNGNQGILRRYNIIPGQNNSGLNATLRLYYDDSENNGLNETGFGIFKSPDGLDNSWTYMGGTVNTAENYVELTGVSDFSHWTIADIGSSLPVVQEKDYTPVEFALHQNYPNPFNPETLIRFELPSESFVNLSVFNIIGEKVVNLVNERLTAGVYKVKFNADELPSGLYLYRLSTDNKVFTKKMMLLK